MKFRLLPSRLALLAACFAFCNMLPAQQKGCVQGPSLANLVAAKTPATLRARKQIAGDSYRVQLVFAARMLELDPRNTSAAKQLLDLIPASDQDPHQSTWLEIDEFDRCSSADHPVSDTLQLSRIRDHLPHLLKIAVLLVPARMPDYVAYAGISISDPHSDYAEQMEAVCRAKHKEFVDAVDKLPSRKKSWLPSMDKSWFVSTIFNPETCRAIEHPEAD